MDAGSVPRKQDGYESANNFPSETNVNKARSFPVAGPNEGRPRARASLTPTTLRSPPPARLPPKALQGGAGPGARRGPLLSLLATYGGSLAA
ncbi:hypothetical protein E2C01_095935 [Portunus trituberculatus]|uniref:Uncharacterized protein n=1 Tax=Portunus trituberculatus TaxID=210409 RepID=A0A5B7JR61_PORTR|nr:hypothetical protein [Portunus trituberculatus]